MVNAFIIFGVPGTVTYIMAINVDMTPIMKAQVAATGIYISMLLKIVEYIIGNGDNTQPEQPK